MNLNVIDRLVGWYSPERGLHRAAARAQLGRLESGKPMMGGGGYYGASKSRREMSEWVVSGGSSDADVLWDLPTLRDRSRDLIRNNPLACGAINTKVSAIIGTGLKVQSRINRERLGLTQEVAAKWQRDAESLFSFFADSPDSDIERTCNFYEAQELIFRSILESGDIFVLLPRVASDGMFSTRFQIVEADRVSNPSMTANTPTLVEGVEKSRNGAPIAYHVANVHPGDFGNLGIRKWERVEAYGRKTGIPNILHIYRKLRPGQSRGVPDLAPVIGTLKQLGRYVDAELMAALVSGMLTVFVQSDGGDSEFAPFTGDGTMTSGDAYKLGNGAIIELSPGQTVQTTNPGRPNAAFDPFVLAILRQVGVALELPYEILIKHFTASYSASRAALLEAWRMYRTRREWLADRLCQPVYAAVITEAVAGGRLVAPGFMEDPFIRAAYLGAEWYGDAQGLLNPLQEVQAATFRVQSGFSTEAKETMELTGGDWDIDEAQRAIETAIRTKNGTRAAVNQNTEVVKKNETDSDL